MWFNKDDIHLHHDIKLENLHGYVLPHAGTKYTGHILSHTLRFKPTKKFENILIIYLPSNLKPNIGKYYHEYYVPFKTLEMIYPDKKFIGYNILQKPPSNISDLNKKNTLYVISADFSHHLPLQSAIYLENCAAHSLMHKELKQPCTRVVDDIRSFKKLYKLLPNIVMQWVGRTRSSGDNGVGYLSFLLRDKVNLKKKIPDGFFVTAYDKNMKQRECLGNTRRWSPEKEEALKNKVIHLGGTTSRLTGGRDLPTTITNYTVTYLYKDQSKDFIRGWHAILKKALYLPDVFLENTFNNGTWIKSTDKKWPNNNNFSLTPTFNMLDNKAKSNISGGSIDYQLFYSQDKHISIKKVGGKRNTYKKRKRKKRKTKRRRRKK